MEMLELFKQLESIHADLLKFMKSPKGLYLLGLGKSGDVFGTAKEARQHYSNTLKSIASARDNLKLSNIRMIRIPEYYYTEKQSTMWNLWMSGYACTGESAPARFLGKIEAKTFNEACEIWGSRNMVNYSSDPEPNYWGCRIFDNEADARRGYG